MLKSIRASLLNTALALTPFLLTACGDDPNTPQKFESVLIPVMFILVTAFILLRQRQVSGQRFA